MGAISGVRASSRLDPRGHPLPGADLSPRRGERVDRGRGAEDPRRVTRQSLREVIAACLPDVQRWVGMPGALW